MKIWIENRHRTRKPSKMEIRRWTAKALKSLHLPHAEVSVVLVDDEEIARLNEQYFQKNGPTNVIAFSMREGEGAHVMPQLLGDVVISLDTTHREAEDGGLSFEERLLQLLVHGILHLLGHDHVGDEDQARRMEAEEARLLAAVERETENEKCKLQNAN